MEPHARPRRVVMVVANRIDGDSRVQKAAQSMAEEGWDVHLVGFSVSGKREQFQRGAYTVHKCPLPDLTPPRSLRQRVAALRFPLAYADTARVEESRLRIKAEWIELDALARERGSHRRDGVLRTPESARKIGRRLQRGWLRRRSASTQARERYLAIENGRLERFERRWWTLLLGDRAWRRLDVNVTRIELALRGKIVKLEPDLIHAHDPYPLGIGARAAMLLRSRGRDVRLVYDAHEFVPGFDALGPDRREALSRYERQYLPHADAVVTVSQPLAALLRQRHGLSRDPAVVLNAPLTRGPERPDPGDLRAACGLGPDTPLAVYSGWASPERRIEIIIEAARRIPELHVAFMVSRHKNPYVRSLKALAEEYGIADRVHFRGYVDYEDLPRFLATADMGIHPIETGPVNHEIALPNKFFEYSHARLPLVVSNVRTMAAEVRRLGNGEVFTSGDAASLEAAIRKVLEHKDDYRRVYDDPALLAEYSWEHQARTYTALYKELLGPVDAGAGSHEPETPAAGARAGVVR